MKKLLKVIFIFTLCFCGFMTCDTQMLSDITTPKKKSKTNSDPILKRIIISDTDLTYGFKVSQIDKDHYIVMALSTTLPPLDDINVQQLMLDSYITLGKPGGTNINLPIYQDFLDYWVERGSFWCIFLELNSSADYAYNAYISKETENFNTINTYLSNVDFYLPVKIEQIVPDLLKGFIDKIGN
jgi:hypothetical protein